MLIQYRRCVNPAYGISQTSLHHTEHLALIFHLGEGRQAVVQNTRCIRHQHHRDRDILISVGEVPNCCQVGIQLILIRHFDILHELTVFSDIDTILHSCSAQPIQPDLEASPHISPDKLVAQIAFPLFHKIS